MSGPKSSRYTLTPEQRRRLEEQRRLERRKAVAKEKIKRSSRSLSSIEGLHSGDRELALAICERLGDVSLKEKLDRLEELAEITYEGIAKVDYNDADSLEGAAELVNNALKEAKELSGSITRDAAEGKEKLLKALDSDIDNGFSASFEELASAKETKLKRLSKTITISIQKRKEYTT